MKLGTIGALVAASIAVSGCASIIKGSSQSIVITSPPVTGAYCVLSSKEGNWPVYTPSAVTVDKSKEDILVHCTKAGYQDASASIPSDFQGWTLGNIVLGGLVGVGVDAATGAMNEYPGAFAIPMTPVAGYLPPMPAPAGANASYSAAGSMPTASGPNLGIGGTSVTPYSSIAIHMSDPHGAFINTVRADGPAARAGLQTGDIVVAFNGLRVDTYDQLNRVVAMATSGTTVTLGVLRQGHQLDLQVQL